MKGDRAALPWTDGSRLISLWDLMRTINAVALYRLGNISGNIDGICSAGSPQGVTKEVTKETREKVPLLLSGYRVACEGANLRISVIAIDDLIRDLKSDQLIDYNRLRSSLNEISNTAERELQCTTILCLNPSRSELFKATNLFGEDVAKNFPRTAFDIEESGNCLATERATAAVFHLIRVVEVGLHALGKTLSVPHLDPSKNPTWEAILGKCDEELRKQRKDRSPDWQSDPEFFTEVTARLRSVKDAWRNPTMHVEKKYTPDEAQDIYNAIRTFMRHIATKLKE